MKNKFARGCFVTNVFKIDKIPAGTVGQVLRRYRSTITDRPNLVKFIGFVGSHQNQQMKDSELNPHILANQVTPLVGDVFAGDWGYDQTQTAWFKIKSVSKSGNTVGTVRLGEVRSRDVDAHLCGKATVDVNDESIEIKSYKLTYNVDGNPSFKCAPCGRAFKTDPTQSRFFSEWA